MLEYLFEYSWIYSFFNAIKKKKRLLEQEGYDSFSNEIQMNKPIDPENRPYSNYRSIAIIIEGSCKIIN